MSVGCNMYSVMATERVRNIQQDTRFSGHVLLEVSFAETQVQTLAIQHQVDKVLTTFFRDRSGRLEVKDLRHRQSIPEDTEVKAR